MRGDGGASRWASGMGTGALPGARLTFLTRSCPLVQTSFTRSLWTVKSVSKASCFFSKPCSGSSEAGTESLACARVPGTGAEGNDLDGACPTGIAAQLGTAMTQRCRNNYEGSETRVQCEDPPVLGPGVTSGRPQSGVKVSLISVTSSSRLKTQNEPEINPAARHARAELYPQYVSSGTCPASTSSGQRTHWRQRPSGWLPGNSTTQGRKPLAASTFYLRHPDWPTGFPVWLGEY